MRIQVVSDLHQEFGSLDFSFNNADLVIFAGDVNLGTKGIEWIKSVIKDIPVLYVLGNHEYYKGSFPKTLNSIKSQSIDTNVYVLENNSIVINDITFHGATLWTDFALLGDPKINGSICQQKMNDYKYIRRDPSFSKLRSIDTYIIHQASLTWLKSSLELTTTEKNVVITHHAPSIKSIPEKLKDNILSSAYASDLESVILKYQPRYWIHGHIHTPANYQVGNTTVLCNPHGYINEPYNGFDKNMIIEI
ncbi:metallophosphoesterase [Chryseolinea soli]|uniref:Phosphoesterase n=1 Tax=Chryseolinea soli TaxID=2321403 RepID=A0A385SN61_9BACT|nr:metallophosphoesterase [Chryseolinea soli]AYB31936.1 phosphoesterase [Chryseolinea soli]